MVTMLEAEGGCLCGAVRYRVSGQPYHLTHCHCTLCRRAAGAPFVTWFSVPSGAFRVTRGEPIRYRSSPEAVRGFCGRCGTQLTFQRDDTPGEVDITVCSLDDPEALTPEDTSTRAAGCAGSCSSDGLPEHSAERDGQSRRHALDPSAAYANRAHRRVDATTSSGCERSTSATSEHSPGVRYENQRKQFQSYFLSFEDGPRIELMHSPRVSGADAAGGASSGYAHLAMSLGSEAAVDALTARLRADGYAVIDGPRRTGDGYYESVVLDPDGNRIELTV